MMLPLRSVHVLLLNTVLQLLTNYFVKIANTVILMKVSRLSLDEQTDYIFNCKWAINI